MLLNMLAFHAIIAQMITLSLTINMLNLHTQQVTINAILEGNIAIGTAWVWHIASHISVAKLTLHSCRVVRIYHMQKKSPEKFWGFTRWGMQSEIADINDRHALIWALPWWGINLYCSLTIAMPAIYGAGIISFGSMITYLFPIIAVMSRMADDFRDLDSKRRDLDDLRPIFHRTFTRLEILSMYESMRTAPRIFWEDYTNLPYTQITESTNEKFRKLAAPYSTTDTAVQQRTATLIAGYAVAIALLIAAPSVFAELTGGGSLTEWLEKIFTTNGTAPAKSE